MYDLPTGMPNGEAITMPPAPEDIREKFKQAGFEIIEVSPSPEKIGVKKCGCVRYITRKPDGGWVPAGPPCLIIRGREYELEDRGYQKFWYREGKRVPIRVRDLKNLQGFDQEARQCLDWKSLYNESLGTTSARSVYDRLAGRRGE